MHHNPNADPSNARILQLLSEYLTFTPALIQPEAMREMTEGCGVSERDAFAMLLAAGCGLDITDNPADKQLYHDYFHEMVHPLEVAAYQANPYYAGIRIPRAQRGACILAHEAYQPWEAFVCDDLAVMPDGRIIPQIGFFSSAFPYPAILENGRVWMTITPNEIETMKAPIAAARGKVLALGLGLGYYAFMASGREEVESVTIIEQNEAVITLFSRHILPQFPHRDKIRIIQDDAFHYLDTQLAQAGYDTLFADLWHDVADGLDLYLRLKPYEATAPGTAFHYWIEDSIRCYV